jgi:hypothetical protein
MVVVKQLSSTRQFGESLFKSNSAIKEGNREGAEMLPFFSGHCPCKRVGTDWKKGGKDSITTACPCGSSDNFVLRSSSKDIR